MNNDKLKSARQVLLQIEKHYGKGAIMKLGDAAGSVDIEVIPTGCLSLEFCARYRRDTPAAGSWRSTARIFG